MKPLVTLLTLLLASASVQAQSGPPIQVGDRVEVRRVIDSEEVWIPATITEIWSGSVRATFPASSAGMSGDRDLNELFQHFFVRLPGKTEPLTADWTSPFPAAEPVPEPDPAEEPAPEPDVDLANPDALPGLAVGDRVRAWCWGTLEDAVVTAIEPEGYRLVFLAYKDAEASEQACGSHREADALVAPEPEEEVRPAPPLPSALPRGAYVCFASTPHYAGSTYTPGVGSVPNYTFTWDRVGDLSITSGSAVRIGRSTYGYRYDAGTGEVTWRGGMHDGVASNVAHDTEGRFTIQIHRKDGLRGTWHCRQ